MDIYTYHIMFHFFPLTHSLPTFRLFLSTYLSANVFKLVIFSNLNKHKAWNEVTRGARGGTEEDRATPASSHSHSLGQQRTRKKRITEGGLFMIMTLYVFIFRLCFHYECALNDFHSEWIELLVSFDWNGNREVWYADAATFSLTIFYFNNPSQWVRTN